MLPARTSLPALPSVGRAPGRAERLLEGRARSWSLGLIALVAAVGAVVTPARAKVHYAKNEALALAFPGADSIETKTFFLTEEEKSRIEDLGKAPLESKLIAVNVGMKNGKPMGYAFIDSQVVRTLPETLLIVISPEGAVAKLLLLAFYEPPEYEASERWLEQFPGKTLGPDLRVDRDIHGIAGSTLTSHAVTTAVRRSLALFQVLVRKQ